MATSRTLSISFLAHLTNDGAELILPTLLPSMAHEFNLSFAQTGFLGGSMVVALGLGQILMGYLSDATGKRRLFISLGLVLLSIGLFGISRSTSYVELILFNLVAGLGASAYHPVGISMISELFKDSGKGKALGLHGTGGNIGMAVFPLLSGILADYLGWRTPFAVFPALGLIIAVVFFATMKDPAKTERRTPLRLVMNQKLLMITLSLGFASMAARGMTVFFPIRIDALGYSSSQIGALFFLMFGAGILGQYFGGYFSDMHSKKHLVIYLSLISSALLLIPFFLTSFVLIALVVLVAGFAKDAVWPPFFALLTDHAPEQLYGTALGMFFSIGYIMASQSPTIIGIVSDYVVFPTSMLLLLVFGVAAALAIRRT